MVQLDKTQTYSPILIPTAAIVLFEVGGGVVAEVRGPIYIANGAFLQYINQYKIEL